MLHLDHNFVMDKTDTCYINNINYVYVILHINNICYIYNCITLNIVIVSYLGVNPASKLFVIIRCC